jgi:hypothetical protein
MLGSIGGDAEQEGAERAARLELADQVGQADENIVHQILGGLAFADDPMAERAQRCLVLVVDTTQRGDVACRDHGRQIIRD